MKESLKKEIESLIKRYCLNCTVDNFNPKIDYNYWGLISKHKLSLDFISEFHNELDWGLVSEYQKLSEDFIRKFQNKVKWNSISVHQSLSESFMKKFKRRICFVYISKYQKLSEDFIRKFKNKVDWDYISKHQVLSENFIRDFQDKVYWVYISQNQKLSESFIREFQNRLDWDSISKYQKLSEDFIKEFDNRINIVSVISHQKLSEDFIYKILDFIYKIFNKNIIISYVIRKQILSLEFIKKLIKEDLLYNIDELLPDQLKSHHDDRTRETKIEEMRRYAEKYNLKFDGEYLYAFREHDMWGRGYFNGTIIYDEKKYYRDWRCDLNPDNENSFGLGIWPTGNTAIKVSVDDWGCEVISDSDGKARVWAFTII